ncbi:MAG TPA: molybdopterin-dependent oxidoreductase [Ktedonobacteraceae bacterium]
MQNVHQTMNTHEKADRSPASRRKPIIVAAFAAFGAGLTASLTTVALMVALRLVGGVPTPVELFGDHILKLLPAARFVDMLVAFSPHSKTTPLGLALLGMIGLGTLLGLLYAAIVRTRLPAASYRPASREWLTALLLAVAMAAAAIVLFWDEIGQNFLGLPVSWAMLVTSLALLADFGLYGLVLCLACRVLLPKQQAIDASVKTSGRRQLLARVGVAAIGAGAAGGTVGLIKGLLSSYTTYDGSETFTHNGFTAPITPTSEHYTVTQNVVDPVVNLAAWRLEVTGLVAREGTYTYEELQNLPSTSRAVTLECIANGIGGHLISTAIWQGVTLQTLLDKHGGSLPGARYIAFYSVDGYSISLPLDEVLAVDPILAWRMNGAELQTRHGYPLRAVIPGRFGEENPKWLTRIELTGHFVGGLYADQGWYNGPLHTITRIDRPAGRVPFNHSIEIGGIAFAGNRGIEKVEVSVDGGISWNPAKLDPPLSQDSWVLWTWQWTPILPGKYTIVARATDGTGQVQTSQKQGTVPDGATGYHTVIVQV